MTLKISSEFAHTVKSYFTFYEGQKHIFYLLNPLAGWVRKKPVFNVKSTLVNLLTAPSERYYDTVSTIPPEGSTTHHAIGLWQCVYLAVFAIVLLMYSKFIKDVKNLKGSAH